jgi:iron(III) transport system substrate-binding protein
MNSKQWWSPAWQWVLGITAATLLAACAAPAAGPSAITPRVAEPGSAPQTAGVPSGSASASGAARADWQAEWERTLAAARQEGTVTVTTNPGQLFRDWLAHFERAYPDIQLELTSMSNAQFAARALAERSGGQYLWDVYLGGANTGNKVLKPAGALDPLKPALIRPDVLDDSKWLGGFDNGFTDVEGQYVYDYYIELAPTVYVNRDFVSEAELSRVEDLVQPQWRGRMSIYDPRQAGKGAADGGHFLQVRGEDWWRQLLSQDLAVTTDRRQQIEWAVRGRYPVGISISNTSVPEFQQKGVGLNLVPLAFRTPLGSRLSMTNNVALLNRAPHPNAARVFINWVLSQEGQQRYAEILDQPSRRLDVESPKERMPDPNVQYPPSVNKEASSIYEQRAREIADEVLP